MTEQILPALVDIIIQKQQELGDAEPLDRVIEVMLADAMACVNDLLLARRVNERFLRLVLDLALVPLLVERACKSVGRVRPRRPLSPDQAAMVMSTLQTLVRPIKNRGIGSRWQDLWRLLWLDAAGVSMPMIADLLRERRTPKSKGRRKAKDPKTLWRLRADALRALADVIAPLLPLPTAVAA